MIKFKPFIKEKEPPDKDEEKKTIRPDVILRKLEHSYYKYTTVKTKINQFLSDKIYHEKIIEAVKIINGISFQAYHFLNLHFLRLLEQNLEIPKSIDQSLIYQVCSLVSTLNNKNKILNEKDPLYETLLLYKNTLPEDFVPPDRNKMGNLINNLSKTMKVAINNHLNLNFRKRFSRYLRLKYKENDLSKVYYWIDRIFNIRDNTGQSKFDNEEASELIINEYKELFKNPKSFDVISKNLNIYLPIYMSMLKDFENNEIKKFTILPIKGELIPSHIKICNYSLRDLISKWTEQKVNTNFMNEKREEWKKIFLLDRFESKNRRFDYEITTNGYDISIQLKTEIIKLPYSEKDNLTMEEKIKLFKEDIKRRGLDKKKRKKKDRNEILEIKEWTEIYGLDPGKRSLFTATNKKGRTVHCSRKEYHHLINQKKYQKMINDRLERNKNLKLNTISFKVSTVGEYQSNLKKIFSILNELLEFYNEMYYRKLRFTKYTRKQNAMNILVKRIKNESKDVIIGYGDGGTNGNGIKGASMPIKGFRDRLKRERSIKVVDINEDYTSKKCSKCHEETGVVRCWKVVELLNKSSKKVLQVCYGLRRCRNNECRITWDRDKNASINIQLLTNQIIKGLDRPSYLKRNQVQRPSDDCT